VQDVLASVDVEGGNGCWVAKLGCECNFRAGHQLVVPVAVRCGGTAAATQARGSVVSMGCGRRGTQP
jgi:hypothetical protein